MRRRTAAMAGLAVLAVSSVAGGTSARFSSVTSNVGSTISASSAVADAGCVAQTPETAWMTGLEAGVTAAGAGGLWDEYVGSTPAASTVMKRSGARSLRIPKAGTAAAYVGKTFTAGTSMVVRAGLAFASGVALPTTTVELATVVAGGNDMTLRYNPSGSKLEVLFVGGTAQASIVAVTAGSWYLFDLKVNVGSSPRTIHWKLDGVTQPPVTNAEAASTSTSVRLGSAVTADAYTAHWDDIMVSQFGPDYPIGDGRILALSPNGLDSSLLSQWVGFQNDDGTVVTAASYSRIDDVPLTSTTDYLAQTGPGSVRVTFEDTTATCIQDVSVLLGYHAAGTTANHGRTTVAADGTDTYTVFDGDMSETGLTYRYLLLPRGTQWSPTTVNALYADIGNSSDVSPVPYWDGLLVEYAASGSVTCTSATAGPSYLTGFESGVAAATEGTSALYRTVSATDGVVAADATVKRHGGYALRVAKTGGTGATYADLYSGTPRAVRFAVRFPARPAATAQFASLFGSGGNSFRLLLTPDGRMRAEFDASAPVYGKVPVLPGTWYVVDVGADHSASPRTASWRINGIAQPTASFAVAGSASARSLRLGSDQTADVVTAYFDDVVISSSAASYPYGDGKVLALSPNANTLVGADFRNEDGTAATTSAYTRLDEVPLDANASSPDYLRQVSYTVNGIVQVSFPDTTEACINGMSGVLAVRSATAGAATGGTQFRMVGSGSAASSAYPSVSGTTPKYFYYLTGDLCCGSGMVANVVAWLTAAPSFAPSTYWDALMVEYDVRL